ncbi:MAG TPA: TSUP family transporter [Anaeromyxobacteraceae bacterium]|nr:TSUP family transporter [Anaeromyxobacteraceae bacterium]
MILPPSTIALLSLAALVAGAVDAIGGGGGLVTVPSLLAAGVPPAAALATNKGQSVFGAAAALARYARAGLVDWRVARATFPAGSLGSLGGAALVLLVPPAALRPLVLGLLLLVAAVLAFRPAAPAPRASRPPRRLAVAAAVSLTMGAYDGFFGPGTGTFLIFAFVWFFDARFQEASADAKVANFASNLAALALFAARGEVLWSVALPMAAANFLGGFLGAHLAVRGGDRVVRLVVLLVVAALVAKLGADLLRG